MSSVTSTTTTATTTTVDPSATTSSALEVTTTSAPSTGSRTVVKQNLKLSGLSKSEVENKKEAFEAAIANILGVSPKAVSITSIKEITSARRRIRSLSESSLQITYTVTASDKKGNEILQLLNEGTSTESSPFLKELMKRVAQIHGRSGNDLKLTSEKAVRANNKDNTSNNEDNTSIVAKDDQGYNLLVVVIIVVLFFLCLCFCGLYHARNLCRKKETKRGKHMAVEMRMMVGEEGPNIINPMREESNRKSVVL